MENIKCGKTCQVYSRVVGYHRPTSDWNRGKREEFKDRQAFDEKISLNSNMGKELL